MDNNQRTIGISTLITLMIISGSMIVPGFFDEPKYYCESRPELGIVGCDSFSKYVSSNGKCVRNENTNLICRDGWLLVEDDIPLPEEQDEPIDINPDNGKTYIPEQQIIQYRCPPNKDCELI